MTRYEVRLDDLAERDLAALPAPVRRRMLARFEALADDPRPHWAKPLARTLRGYWGFRIGDYRAAYNIDDDVRRVHVWNAGHRGPLLRDHAPPTAGHRLRAAMLNAE